MADVVTTFLNLTNPEVGASADSWGGKENVDRVTVDAMLSTLITGLTLSTAGGSGTFGIAVGAASGMVLASAYTKTTGAWAVGTGNGALDTGAIANNTWYHAYLIQRIDTGVVDPLISLSPTSPTLPASYTRKRRIGSMLTDGSAHWVKFIQNGNKFLWDVGAADDVDGIPAITQTLGAVTVPSGVIVEALISGFYQGLPGASSVFLISSPLISGITSISGSFPPNWTVYLPSGGATQGFEVAVLTNTSRQVNYISNTADAATLTRFGAYGWNDARGQG